MQNDDYGKDYWEGFKEGLGKDANKVVKHVTYEVTDPTVDSQVIQLKDSGANVFFNISTPKFAAQAMRKAGDIGWKPAQYLNNVSSQRRLGDEARWLRQRPGRPDGGLPDGPHRQAVGRQRRHEGVGRVDGQVQRGREPVGRVQRVRLCGRQPDARDAEEVRQRPDAREPHEAGGQLPEVELPMACCRASPSRPARPTSIRSRRSSCSASRARPGSCSARSCTPRAAERPPIEEGKAAARRPFPWLFNDCAVAPGGIRWRRCGRPCSRRSARSCDRPGP